MKLSRMARAWALTGFVAAPLAAQAAAALAVEQATMEVFIDGAGLRVEFRIPTELAGGAPAGSQTAAQVRDDILQRLQRIPEWVRPDPVGQCRQTAQSADVGPERGSMLPLVTAMIDFTCARPHAVSAVTLDVWSVFPQLQRVQVSLVTAERLVGRRLTREAGGAPAQISLVGIRRR